MNFTNKAPIWNAEGQQPTKELQEQGFTAGYKPPAAYFNYMFNQYTKSINETQQKLGEVETQMQDSQLYPSKKVNGAAIAINDSANLPFAALSVYGKSTQDGTPTPDAPIDIVSAGDSGNIELKVLNKNLFAKQDDYSAYGVTVKWLDNGLQINGTLSQTSLPISLFEDKLPSGTYCINGISGASSSAYQIVVYKDNEVFKYITTDTRTFTIDETATIKVVLYIYSAYGTYSNLVLPYQMEIGTVATEFEPYKNNMINITTPNGLLGIPVTSGGNYTDENGQQWICDEIDLTRGVRIQRIVCTEFNGSENWLKSTDNNNNYMYHTILSNEVGNADSMCNRLIDARGVSPLQVDGQTTDLLGYFVSEKYNVLYVNLGYYMTANTVDELVSVLAANPLTVHYILATPIETALTAAEIAAYKALTTNNPNTTVINDSGAGMSVEYITQTYDGALGMLADKIKDVEENITPIQAGTEDLTAGTTALASGTIYCVYE